MTLREWQQKEKPREELIYNASVQDGSDGWLDFTIGMGYLVARYSGTHKEIQIGNHLNMVHCGINPGTDARRRPSGINRKSILATLEKNGIKNKYLPEDRYFRTLPTYKFIISPEGNGIDCHRHYEALMAGCIPIVEDNIGIRKKYEGCPVLYTKNYSEITTEYLTNIWNDWLDTEWDFSKLILSTYSAETRRQIRENGNHWGNRLLHKKWYL